MRTNIVLDDDLVAAAMKYSSARTKRAIVREALATYVAVKTEQLRTESYRNRLAAIRQQLTDKPVRTSSRDIVRADRERRT